MWNGGSGFEEEEAAARIGLVDAASLRLPGERDEIAFIIVAAERKAKAILTGSGSVACAGVATGFGEDRLNVIAEGEFRGVFISGKKG